MFTPEQLEEYIEEIVETNTIETEIFKVQQLMVYNTKYPDKLNPDKIKSLTQLFKALLKQKELLHTATKIYECVETKQEENTSKNV